MDYLCFAVVFSAFHRWLHRPLEQMFLQAMDLQPQQPIDCDAAADNILAVGSAAVLAQMQVTLRRDNPRGKLPGMDCHHRFRLPKKNLQLFLFLFFSSNFICFFFSFFPYTLILRALRTIQLKIYSLSITEILEMYRSTVTIFTNFLLKNCPYLWLMIKS